MLATLILAYASVILFKKWVIIYLFLIQPASFSFLKKQKWKWMFCSLMWINATTCFVTWNGYNLDFFQSFFPTSPLNMWKSTILPLLFLIVFISEHSTTTSFNTVNTESSLTQHRWVPDTQCSKSCKIGTQIRIRQCNTQFGDNRNGQCESNGSKNTDSRYCNQYTCK